MNDEHDDFRDFHKMNMEKEIFDKAFSMTKTLLDKVKPDWERDVEFAKLRMQVVLIVATFLMQVRQAAKEHFRDVYEHIMEVNRGLLGPSRRLRQSASDAASEAADEHYDMLLEDFQTIFIQLAPYFFISGGPDDLGGQEVLSTLKSQTMNLTKDADGKYDRE